MASFGFHALMNSPPSPHSHHRHQALRSATRTFAAGEAISSANSLGHLRLGVFLAWCIVFWFAFRVWVRLGVSGPSSACFTGLTTFWDGEQGKGAGCGLTMVFEFLNVVIVDYRGRTPDLGKASNNWLATIGRHNGTTRSTLSLTPRCRVAPRMRRNTPEVLACVGQCAMGLHDRCGIPHITVKNHGLRPHTTSLPAKRCSAPRPTRTYLSTYLGR